MPENQRGEEISLRSHSQVQQANPGFQKGSLYLLVPFLHWLFHREGLPGWTWTRHLGKSLPGRGAVDTATLAVYIRGTCPGWGHHPRQTEPAPSPEAKSTLSQLKQRVGILVPFLLPLANSYLSRAHPEDRSLTGPQPQLSWQAPGPGNCHNTNALSVPGERKLQ